MDEMTGPALQLEVWSDVACPWCFIGRRSLGIALADLDERERPTVTWRAFQLDPLVPDGGVDAEGYFAARFGSLEQAREVQERVRLAGEDVGITFRFDRQRVVPNTILAHRTVAAAASHDVVEPVIDELFAAHFERGVDIADPQRLRELVLEAVIDPELANRISDAAEQDPATEQSVRSDLQLARELGITAVPCFVADRKVAVPGAVPANVLAQFIEQAAAGAAAAD